jgi:Holliday junction resolvasome RuvABC ATP-dependent DNA helicase subunit
MTALTVGGNGTGAGYRSIGEALRAAPTGSVISVRPGEYPENLVLTRDVTIRAETGPGSVVVAPPGGVVLLLAAGSATVRDVTLRASDPDAAAVDVPTGRLGIEHCEIVGAAYVAVRTRGSGTVAMTGCRVENTLGAGVILACGRSHLAHCVLEGNGATALVLTEDAEPEVRDCVIRGGSGNGVFATGRARGSIADCDISATGQPGVALDGASATSIVRTRIHDLPGVGVYATTDTTAVLEDCWLADTGSDGVLLTAQADPVLRRCRVERAAHHGVHVSASARGSFDDVEIGGAGRHGVRVAQAARPAFHRLRVHGCGVQVADQASASFDQVRVVDPAGDAVTVASGATAVLRHAVVAGAGRYGILVDRDGRCRLEDSEVTDAGSAGLCCEGGDADVTDTSFHRTGVLVHEGGVATLVACSVTAAPRSGVELRGPGRLSLTGTSVRDGAGTGVVLSGPADASLTRCDVSGNAGDGIVAEATGEVAIQACLTTDNTGAGLVRGDRHDNVSVVALTSTGNAVPERRGATAPGQPVPTPGAAAPPGAAVAPDVLGPLRAELESLVGLANVKREVQALVNLLQIGRQRQALGMPVPPMSRHLVFAGPPGTGKTTVARLYGKLLAALGVLPSGHVVEVGRVDLVAQVVGGTAIKTAERFKEAIGGVFFIDEAYTLAALERSGGADFGREAVDALVKLMEDHRDEVVVIAAGYTTEMSRFIASNVGLASRFTRTIQFASYAPEELVTIVERMCRVHGYQVGEPVRAALVDHFGAMARDESFGNARVARQVFQDLVERQAQRLAGRTNLGTDDLATFTEDDVPSAA